MIKYLFAPLVALGASWGHCFTQVNTIIVPSIRWKTSDDKNMLLFYSPFVMRFFLFSCMLLSALFSLAQGNSFPSSGDVGVGTVTPASKLDVKGSLTLDMPGGPNLFTGIEDFEQNRYLSILNSVYSRSASGIKVGGLLVSDSYGYANPGKNDLIVKGNVGIGTASPLEKLAVNGTIRAKEIKVEATPWPDYVFEETYDLKPLSEVEQFIKVNKHLPDVPSAKQVAADGLAVGEMQKLMMTKIEELTLHLIAKDKEIQRLRSLESEVSELRKLVENIRRQ